MLQHLDELRQRIINSLLLLAAVFCCCFYFSNNIYNAIASIILDQLPSNTQLIATQVTAPFMVPMQLCVICTLLICAPFLLYQLWMFVRPGLYKNERHSIAPLLFISSILFYVGIAFALYVVCPVALKFFMHSAPQRVQIMLDLGDFMDFVVTLAIASGVAFQIPIVTHLLVRSGLVSKQQLIAKRKHIIVLTLVLGMLLAPPDVASQIMLALPMWGLFELGLLFSRTRSE